MTDSRFIVDPTAKIAADVKIGPFSIIGPNVEIGSGTVIASHVVIKENTKIGKNNKIHSGVVLGDDPQHVGYKGEPTYLEIGDGNIFREFCTVHRGSHQGGGVTKIGNKNYIMNYAHIAHDCIVGNEVILANNASLAGHVNVGDYVMLSAFCGAHQHVNIGPYSFLGRATKIGQDIPAYVLVTGLPGSPNGLNLVGLKRHGFDEQTIRKLRKAFQIVYREDKALSDAMVALEGMVEECPQVQLFIDSIKSSKRGLARRGLRSGGEEY